MSEQPTSPPDREGRSRAAMTETLVSAGRALGHASSMFNHACAERLGLHPTDWECVTLLDDAPGGLTAGQLAELTGRTTGAITGVIDRLEAAGFARRARDPADRRRVVVELDPTKLGEAAPVIGGMIADMVALQSEFSEDELRAVVDVLTRAGGILRAHALDIRAQTRAAG
ncbi:MAG TPA: MarR family transcriptional regulator [Acidimicrobiales bacterium]|nr:MarR family transcriptional regulator [Acidimicrobiales bacterium]